MSFFGRSGASVVDRAGRCALDSLARDLLANTDPRRTRVLVLFVVVVAALALLVTLLVRRSRFAHHFATGTGTGLVRTGTGHPRLTRCRFSMSVLRAGNRRR